jgi:hypothetical protein
VSTRRREAPVNYVRGLRYASIIVTDNTAMTAERPASASMASGAAAVKSAPEAPSAPIKNSEAVVGNAVERNYVNTENAVNCV